MGIAKNLKEILENFEIFGLCGDAWEEFKKETEY